MNYKKMSGYKEFHRNKISKMGQAVGAKGKTMTEAGSNSHPKQTIPNDGDGMRQSMHGRSFSKGKMSVVAASGMVRQSGGNKQSSIEADQPVTKMKHAQKRKHFSQDAIKQAMSSGDRASSMKYPPQMRG